MKTKTTSKRIALLGCALLALTIFAPAVVEAVTIDLDNPNQSVAAPPSGTTILDFAGTITLNPDYHFTFGILDDPFNASRTHSLTSTFTAAFLNFFNTAVGPATFTGSIFEVSVPAGTPPDLYAFPEFPDPNILGSEIFLNATLPGGFDPLSDRQTFSVLVTGVPDRGSSILLLGLSLAALWSFHALKRVAA